MSKSLNDLAKICKGGPYTIDIELGIDCAGSSDEVTFPDDFEIGSYNLIAEDIVLSCLNDTAGVSSPIIVTASFGGVNGFFADQTIHNYDNFYFTTGSPVGTVTITPINDPDNNIIAWEIHNNVSETVTFTLKSVESWDNYYGANIEDIIFDNPINIQWISI